MSLHRLMKNEQNRPQGSPRMRNPYFSWAHLCPRQPVTPKRSHASKLYSLLLIETPISIHVVSVKRKGDVASGRIETFAEVAQFSWPASDLNLQPVRQKTDRIFLQPEYEASGQNLIPLRKGEPLPSAPFWGGMIRIPEKAVNSTEQLK